MTNTEKTKIVAENLNSKIKYNLDRHVKSTRKQLKQMLKNYEDDPYYLFYDVAISAISEAYIMIAGTIRTWENEGIAELQGITPKEYFSSLESVNEIIEIISFITTDIDIILVPSLVNKIIELKDSISDELFRILENMQVDESKCLNNQQLAAIKIAGISALPKYLNPILNIFTQLDSEKTDEDTYAVLTRSLVDIGMPALNSIINMIENSGQNDKLYPFLIDVVAKIGHDNKSEDIYNFLKKQFRNSEFRVIEAKALATYGDGRAIPAIRGYIEKNLDEISSEEYDLLRHAILDLGGNTDDLDEYFEDYEDYEEEDYEKIYDEEFGEED